MSQTELNFELRKLFKETEVRFPAQKLDSDTKQAYLQDWKEKSARVGFKRFEAGVKRARESGNYFPMICDINPLIPDSIGKDPRDEAWEREFKELCQRKRMGEKFWTGADVFYTVASKILDGEIKPSDPGWYEWAKHFKASTQRAK